MKTILLSLGLVLTPSFVWAQEILPTDHIDEESFPFVLDMDQDALELDNQDWTPFSPPSGSETSAERFVRYMALLIQRAALEAGRNCLSPTDGFRLPVSVVKLTASSRVSENGSMEFDARTKTLLITLHDDLRASVANFRQSEISYVAILQVLCPGLDISAIYKAQADAPYVLPGDVPTKPLSAGQKSQPKSKE